MKIAARILAVLLAAFMVCGAFGGCGKSKSKSKGTGSADSAVSETGGENGAESGGTGGTESGGNNGGAGNTSSSKGGTAAGTQNGNTTGKDSGGKRTLQFWCGFGQPSYNTCLSIADDFNASQNKYVVKVSYNGDSSELRTRLMTLSKSKRPTVFFGTPLTIAQYAENDFCVPLQKFYKDDPDKWADDMYANVRTAYSDKNGNLIGSPVGLSLSGWGVNVDKLAAIGKSVKDCTSFETICGFAKTAKEKGLVTYGITFNQGQDVHDMLRVQGKDIVDKSNGFGGTPTKSLLKDAKTTGPAFKKLATLMADLYKNGVAHTYTAGQSGHSFASLFKNGDVLFWSNTNSYIGTMLSNVGKPNFNYDFIPTTGIDEQAAHKGESLCEGTGLFIADNGSEADAKGGYELIKFFASVPEQEKFCTQTTYMPFTKSAAASKKIADYHKTIKFDAAAATIRQRLEKSTKDIRGTYAALGNEMTQSLGDFTCAISTIRQNMDQKTIDSLIEKAINDTDNRLQTGINMYGLNAKK